MGSNTNTSGNDFRLFDGFFDTREYGIDFPNITEKPKEAAKSGG
jgi:hypothetical protein